MARLPRIVIPDEPLHIMHRGNNRQDIFQSEEDYFRFLDDLKTSLKQYDCDLHAYKQLFEGRIHVKMIKLFNDSAEKGDVLGDEGFHRSIERLIDRVTIY